MPVRSEDGFARGHRLVGDDGALGTAPLTRTAEEIYAELLERGETRVPALRIEGGRLVPDGYTILIKVGETVSGRR